MNRMSIDWMIWTPFVLLIVSSSIKIVKESERAVIFRLGHRVGVRGPGLFFIIPILEKMVKIDLSTTTFDVSPQQVMAQDEKTVRVSMVIHYRVTDPEKAVTQVEQYHAATERIVTRTLKDVAAQTESSDFYGMGFKEQLRETINEKTDPFGIEVSEVEIKDVKLPDAWGTFIGVETGFDLVMLGSALVLGGLLTSFADSWLATAICASLFCVLYVGIGRRYIRAKMKLRDTRRMSMQ